MKWTSDSGREVEVEKRERETRSTDGTDCSTAESPDSNCSVPA